MRKVIVAVLALVAIAMSGWRMAVPVMGLDVRDLAVGTTPVTSFERRDAVPGPTVVIAHGFAGSRQLMHPFAVTLAQAGYRALVFDFPGHGRNPVPLGGSITEESGATEVLVKATLEVLAHARTPPGAGLALLGHSMASDIVIRAAQRDGAVDATVAVSMFSPVVTADSPRNLLVVVGEWEPSMLTDEARRVVGLVSGDEPPQAGRVYGDVASGSARRLVIAGGAEHIGVLYAEDSLVAARDWLNRVFGRDGAGPVDHRGPWLALMIAGLVALGWPLAALLPRVARRPAGAGLRWRRLWPLIVGPAVATPLVLSVVPTDFLPVLVGDYLAAHFGLYGLLTAVGLWMLRRRAGASPSGEERESGAGAHLPALLVGGAAVAGFATVALGGALDHWFASFWPIRERMPLVLAMLAGTLPFFLAIEWTTRGDGHAFAGHAAAKAAFLGSLALAVALDPQGLFFLIMIVPAILIFFLIFGLFASWACTRTGHPAVGAIGNAVALAMALAVTFPMLDA